MRNIDIPGGRHIETVELLQYRIDRIGNEILANNECMRFLLGKFDAKFLAKDTWAAGDDGTNDYSEWKTLGNFLIHHHYFPYQLAVIMRRNGIDIYSDEEAIELHIPSQSNLNLQSLSRSFERLREYISAISRSRRRPVYIYGVSHLSRYAQRYGFHVVDIPESLKDQTGSSRVLEKYNEKMKNRFTLDDIKLAYVSVDDFSLKTHHNLDN